MVAKLVWHDLPKRQGMFTTRNAVMVSLDNNSIIRHFSANTKINVVQWTEVDGVRYYRTESAAIGGLNWAFKASEFGLPDMEQNSLVHITPNKKSEDSTLPRLVEQKNAPKEVHHKSEPVVDHKRKRSLTEAFKRFFKRSK